MANTNNDWDETSESTLCYIFIGMCALLLGILGWLAEHYQWFVKKGMVNSILGFVFGLFDWKCFEIAGVCAVFTLIGVIVDRKWGQTHYDYDLDSPWWVAFSVVVALACVVLVIPELNRRIMTWEYGHEMGLSTVYWEQEGALLCSIRNLLMYVLSFLFIILLMRQWIRMILLDISLPVRIVLGILLFPLYPAGAIALSYCFSVFLAIGVIGFIFYKILHLLGIFGEAKVAVDEATELERNHNYLGLNTASKAALHVLADDDFASLRYDAQEELKRREEED